MPTRSCARLAARSLLLALLLTGCNASSCRLLALPVTGPMAIADAAKAARAARRAKPIRDLPPGARLAAPPDAALVVFVRPSARDPDSTAILHDDLGRFIGELPAASYLAVTFPPEDYVFFAWSENAGAFKVWLAEGKTYYVEVDAQSGIAGTRAELLAIKPGSARWAKMPEWIGRAKRVVADRAAGQAYLDARKGELQTRIERGLRVFDDASREERDARTLGYDDGT